MKEYTSQCEVCDTEMNVRSKDGTQIYCPSCWVPKPVPLEYLGANARLTEKKRLKSVVE